MHLEAINARTGVKTKVLREKNKRSVVILLATKTGDKNFKWSKWNILEIRIMWKVDDRGSFLRWEKPQLIGD